MSEQELAQVEQMLKNLLLPDNTKRKEAETQLQSCLSNIKNKESLSLYCSILLQKSTELNVQTYCAIILRKIFLTNEKEISNEAVKNFSVENKNEIKKNSLSALQNITNKSLRKQIADACIKIFEGLIENEEKWQELLEYIVSLFKLNLDDSNVANIELGLYLLSNIYSFAYDELKEGTKLFLQNFSVYFKSEILSLKTRTVQCITELLCSSSSKKETKQFKDFIFYILETTLQCFQKKDIDNLKLCLDCIQDLANSEPKILRKNFNDIYILMGKITLDKDLEESIREICYEIIVTIIEGMPKVIDDQKLKDFVQGLFKYAMELDQTIDDEWLHPDPVSFVSDEFIPEHKLDEATSLLSRLFEKINEEKMLKLTGDNVFELINHSSEKDWKYKYIAYITVAEIIGYVKELSSIEKLINMILADVNNQNIKVQYASLYCIAELSDQHNPDFQNDYHSKVVPEVTKILLNSKCLRTQLECCDVLDCFIEHVTDETAALYMKDCFDSLFQIFIKDDNECPPALKEGILDVVQEFINASEEEFKKYSDKCLQILLNYLSDILTKNINRNLIGPLLETISIMGPLCPELFKKCLITIVNTLIQIHINMPNFKENIANYLLSTWEKIIPNLKEENKDKIPSIINSLIELIKKPPEMSVSANPNQQIDVQEFFADEEKKEEEQKKEKVEIKTSETEEFSIFIEILNAFLTDCSDLCNLEQISQIYPVALKLIKYPNTNIQIEISKTFSLSIEILSKLNLDVNQFQSTSKQYISDIVQQLSKETDFSLIVSFVDAIKLIIKSTKLFLTTPEINELTKKILELFDKVENSRLALIKQKDETVKEFEKDKKTGDNKIYSDDEDDNESEEEAVEEIKEQIDEVENVLTSLSEFFGTLFETHKNLTLEIVDKIIKEYLPKYFNDNSSFFEKTLGLLLVSDMAEFLQQNVIGNIWTDICKIMIKYSNHKDNEVRNAACYGLGVFSQYTFQNYNLYANDIIKNIISAIKIPIDKNLSKNDKETMKFARDNAVSALGKIIKYQGKGIDELDNLLDLWVNSLPITKDDEEGLINNQFLMEILKKDPSKVMGQNNKNLQQIIVILTKCYETDSSTEELNKSIEEFSNGIKNNPEYSQLLNDLLSKQKGKTLNKIKALFKINK